MKIIVLMYLEFFLWVGFVAFVNHMLSHAETGVSATKKEGGACGEQAEPPSDQAGTLVLGISAWLGLPQSLDALWWKICFKRMI